MKNPNYYLKYSRVVFALLGLLCIEIGVGRVDAAGQNLVLNAGFENGQTNWTGWNTFYSVASTNTHSGAKACRYIGDGVTWNQLLSDGMTVNENTLYSFQTWVKMTNRTKGYMKARIRWLNSSNATLRDDSIKFESNMDYTLFNREYTSPVGSVKVTVAFICNNLNGQTYLDDISLIDPNESAGWTEIPLAADSKVIYVSSSEGIDGVDRGLSESTPVATLQNGRAKLRAGYSDRMLLKRGDVWVDETFGGPVNGRSAEEPTVLSYYGNTGARPLLKVTDSFIQTTDKCEYFAMIGLHVTSYKCDPNDPDFIDPLVDPIGAEESATNISFKAGGEAILFEDCKLEFIEIILEGWAGDENHYYKNCKIRRCIITDKYWLGSTTSRATRPQGLFLNETIDLLVEDCVFDHNGWSDHPNLHGLALANMYNHNIYTSNNSKRTVVRNCILARGSAQAIHGKGAGVFENNLMVNNTIGFSMGGGDTVFWLPYDYLANAMYNVIIDGRSMEIISGEQSAAVYGFTYGRYENLENKPYVEGNIISRRSGVGNNLSFSFDPEITYVDNIVYSWAGRGAENEQADMWDPRWVDPNRSVESYHASLGQPATLESFLEAARNRGLKEWWPEYTADAVNSYIRAGFELLSIPTNVMPVGWDTNDIWIVQSAGSALYTDSSDSFTLEGDGALGGKSDKFRYVYTAIDGDCTVMAKVVYNDYPNDLALAGLMIRESLLPYAKMASVSVLGKITEGVEFRYRSENNTDTVKSRNDLVNEGNERPQLLALVRSGNVFTASFTPDNGQNWYPLGTPQTIAMDDTIYVGMHVSSNQAGSLNKAAFTDLQIVGTTVPLPPPPPPTPSDDVILDNQDWQVEYVGSWWEDTHSLAYGPDYHTCANSVANKARYFPGLSDVDNYEVLVRYTNEKGGTDCPYTVSYNGGSTTIRVNQTLNPGTWVSLGIYPLNQQSYVEIGADLSNSKRPCADAVRFIKQ